MSTHTHDSPPLPELALQTPTTDGDRAVLTSSREDGQVRWRPGDRLERIFEEVCDRRDKYPRIAVEADDVVLTYQELDERSNRLARRLLELGVGPGDRVALLFDHAVPAYAAMLAVLKVHAAYVPLDPGFPEDRVAYIIDDAGVSLVLTLACLRDRASAVDVPLLCLDEDHARIDGQNASRPSIPEDESGGAEVAYLIYTSGSTGRPKGVIIEHASICNFVRVAAENYGITSRDRVYQGMTIAFDFSVEEIWVPWAVGATLVPKPRGTTLLGADLTEFLLGNRVTAMCCVPTLLSTVEEELPDLRFLLVSGETCPRDLIVRWYRPDRRFLNVYGPTEATVTATMAVARPDVPVTLGEPLPTYTAVILAPDEPRALGFGELGEIGLAGIGLARGYVNRDDLTDKAFIPDFLGIPDNPSGRIYRTGDLGRITEDGDIEYHGRIDTQVKVRGYRIELSEIESVLLRIPGVAQAVVNTYEPEPGLVELVGCYTLRRDGEELQEQEIRERLRERLPGYMVPAYFERLEQIPMLPSNKADRKSLPPPSGPRTTGSEEYTAPGNETERILAEALAAVLHVDQVSVAADFYTDLGANSMLMAQFSGRLRKDARVPPPAMRDLYLHPTVATLATAMQDVADAPEAGPERAPTKQAARVSTAQYVLCGALQALFYVLTALAVGFVLLEGYLFTEAGQGLAERSGRAFVFGVLSLTATSLLPVVAKWVLIGRWTVEEFPVWSFRYVRFWIVKTLVRATPMRLFIGTPVYGLYLRALGAKIGRRTAIFSPFVPVCTDLLSIGDDTVIRKDAVFNGYRADQGMLQTGRVTIGRSALVGEGSVLDIDTSIGDGAQLGHASSLHTRQSVPAGQRWHGSPAVMTETDYRAVEPTSCGTLRRVTYSMITVVSRLGLTSTVLFTALSYSLPSYLALGHLDHSDPRFYAELLSFSLIIFLGVVSVALCVIAVVPRVLNLALQPDRVYPLYGWHYAVQRTISRLTNSRFFMELTGDSSLVVHYLNLLGYQQPALVQTGSNFGAALKHDNPFSITVGSGTMVADGLSIMSADYSSSSFKVSRTSIGAWSYFGNNVQYPSGARTGTDCLFATKVLVPVDGPIREGVGLLGSPSFEIPRSVRRDTAFKDMATGAELRRRLHEKNRHNAVTIAGFLVSRWFYTFVAMLLSSFAVALHTVWDSLVVTGAFLGMLLFTVGYFVLLERLSLGFRRLAPLFCSIYERPFWRHERYWKFSATVYLEMFNGTPFKILIWRLLGVRMGRQVFDDGCHITEKTLASVGDHCTLNALATVQSHSMEDGAFKLEPIVIGHGCTLGVNSYVHYGTTVGDRALVEADSFLMKGTEIPADATFGGNPARELPARAGAPPSLTTPRPSDSDDAASLCSPPPR
ncbi:Pls/PosA family non-ribosomal peptide synthetase [Kocuria sabuli]|uniref:Pls/PosA family non-ribosomal peptide synthetase n=1 Tax=Kocuria sabuli TaxID=3071448 RepID=UPI0034D5777A